MIEVDHSKVIVNIHGLMGEKEVVQIELEEKILFEKGQFVFENVAYEIVRVIKEDVEHPVIYVIILNILGKN